MGDALSPVAPPGAAGVRVRLRRHEVGLARLAGGMLFFGSLFAVGGVATLAGGVGSYARGETLVGAGLMIVFGAGQLVSGFALRALSPRARPLALVACAALLLVVPVGTVVGILGGVLLLSAGGREVLSPAHAGVRAATPELDPWRAPVIVPLVAPFVLIASFWAIYQVLVAAA